MLFLWPILLSTISIQSLGYFIGITCGNRSMMALIIANAFQLLYSGVMTRDEDLFIGIKYLSMLNPAKMTALRMITYLYGFDMCPSGQTSALMTYMGWTDDLYNESLYLLIFQSIFFTIVAYICLKFKLFLLK